MRNTLYVTDREQWRGWLQQNHETESEVWLVFYKKTSGKPRIPYDEAVEEALCFGWIDSLVRRIDEEKYAQKFTPRKVKSKWSASNRERIARLMREGRMTEAGLAKAGFLSDPDVREDARARRPEGEPVPPPVERALRLNGTAWDNFRKLAPSYRRNYVGWIMAAKRQETRDRRLEEAVRLLEQNKKLGMK